MDQIDEHFIKFTESLTLAIDLLDRPDSSEFLERQQRQVEELVALEHRFRAALRVLPGGLDAYEAFIRFIRDECNNILDARPYFRERHTTFTPHIANALKTRDPVGLSAFAINYRLVRFAVDAIDWGQDSEVLRLAAAIEKVRTELIVLNLPLAVARARIFFSRNSQGHLEYMDLIQIAALGLMSGIDKFVPPYTRMFRGVAIGRIVGDLIEGVSNTMVHFYPTDKRLLYNVNKISGRQVDDLDYEQVAEKLNELIKPVKKTTASELANLVSAAYRRVSMDAPTGDEEVGLRPMDTVAAPLDSQPDVLVEQKLTNQALFYAIGKLIPFERKLLKCFGVGVSE